MVTLDRSYVICHMMTSIDGKIASGIKSVNIFDEYYNTYSQLEGHFKPQAWMCGRVTSEEFAEAVNTPLPETKTYLKADDFRSSTPGSGFMVAVDTKGQLRWKTNTLTFGDQSVHHIIVIVTHKTPNDYLAYLQSKNISYIFGGDQDLDFAVVFQKLKKDFGIETLALEGGGRLNGSVIAAGLVDEISLLLCPFVLNRSGAPTMSEKQAESKLDIKQYTLTETKQLDNGTVWLRYKKV